MSTTDGFEAAVPICEGASPSDARLLARAMSLHEQFMHAHPTSSPPTRTEVRHQSVDAEVRMYDKHDVLVARYHWDSKNDNMRKVSISGPRPDPALHLAGLAQSLAKAT